MSAQDRIQLSPWEHEHQRIYVANLLSSCFLCFRLSDIFFYHYHWHHIVHTNISAEAVRNGKWFKCRWHWLKAELSKSSLIFFEPNSSTDKCAKICEAAWFNCGVLCRSVFYLVACKWSRLELIHILKKIRRNGPTLLFSFLITHQARRRVGSPSIYRPKRLES